ncbi:cytochrome P450 [Kordia sp. YSTF-M3]|uniref:Cytochrome P450 n=1 Tax=Kordia aestuariivivens TaxID=2759037 RepID=A0ABR7QE94_9FLAO|nr:cytochrome P450 [Kordia aestuariivivens]MBC8756886.1 cytochrome P450 [Kordia aestuariivivens]
MSEYYSFYENLRAMGPMKINETWLISRFQDVKTAFEAPEAFTNDKTTPFFAYNSDIESYSYKERFAREVLEKWINHTNNDVSHIKNQLTSQLFSYVQNDMDSCIENTLKSILDSMEGDTLDYKKDIAIPVMSRISEGVLGISQSAKTSQFDELLYKHADSVSFLREEVYLDKTMAEKFADSLLYFLKLGSDFTGDYDVFDKEEYDISNFDIFQIQQSIVFSAMVFNTVILLCNTIKILIENKDKFNKSELNKAILEAIRLESPIQSTLRITKEKVEIGGVNIPKGENLILLIGSANRDDEQGKLIEPDSFKIDRTRKPIMTFGHGVHACIGKHMSLRIAEIVNKELLYNNNASLVEFEWDKQLKGHRDLQLLKVKLDSKISIT